MILWQPSSNGFFDIAIAGTLLPLAAAVVVRPLFQLTKCTEVKGDGVAEAIDTARAQNLTSVASASAT